MKYGSEYIELVRPGEMGDADSEYGVAGLLKHPHQSHSHRKEKRRGTYTSTPISPSNMLPLRFDAFDTFDTFEYSEDHESPRSRARIRDERSCAEWDLHIPFFATFSLAV